MYKKKVIKLIGATIVLTFVSFLFARCYLNKVADRFLDNYYNNQTSNYSYYNNMTYEVPSQIPQVEPMFWNATFNMSGNGSWDSNVTVNNETF